MSAKKYRVNEIFYSLQGEGRWAGRAAIFIRFSGCNLKCPFCDTDFRKYHEMTVARIIETIKPWKNTGFVVLTGGEPTLQVDNTLTDALHDAGFVIAMETNGTHKVLGDIDWVTISPKTPFVSNGEVVLKSADELKLVYTGENKVETYGIDTENLYLQPCDTGDIAKNEDILKQCINYIKENPQWKISIQQQKILKVR